jgi:hypothetical protein
MGAGKYQGWAVFGLATALACVAFGARGDANDGNHGPLRGDYLEYSGTLDDALLPTKSDSKLEVRVTGKLAADMFRHLGPAAKSQSCGNAEETRSRGDLICVSGAGKGAECFIGLDVLKGRSINGRVC